MILKKYLIFIVILFSIVICGAVHATEKDADYLDIYTLSMVSDIRNYILAIQLGDGNNLQQNEFLKESLSSKLSDLAHYLAELKNTELVSNICGFNKKHFVELKKLSNNCANDICEGAYIIERICKAKNFTG